MVKQKFEIATLNSDNLVELDGFKNSQLKLVKDHPLVIAKDPKSYSEAKVNRTALKTGRTTIQSQDKIIASTIQTFRKGTVAKKDELIAITKPGEDLQQESINQWEFGIQWCKDVEEIGEAKRIEGIKNGIKNAKEDLQDVIEGTTFKLIELNEKIFNDKTSQWSENDFHEFDFLFEEMLEEKRMEMVQKIEEVKQDESTRLEQLAKDQQSKIDSLFREATEMIDIALVDTINLLHPALKEILDVEFDYGDTINNYIEMYESITEKANVKIEWLKEQKEKVRLENIQIQKQQVINNREGLLDLVFQMDVDNYKTEKEKIKNAVDQDFEKTVPDAKEEVKKLKSRVNDALKRKLEEIDGELIKAKEKKEAEKKQMEETALKIVGLHNERIEKVKKLGFIHEKGIISGFGISMDDYEVDECDLFLKDKDFDTLLIELKSVKKTFRENDKKEKARQKRLDPERKILIAYVDESIRTASVNCTLKQPEMIEAKKMIKASVNALCDELIEQLKSI